MATAVRPSKRALRDAEDTAALEAMQSEPEAVGAYDHIPFASATAVFLVDTASEVFVIHRAQVRITQHVSGMATMKGCSIIMRSVYCVRPYPSSE